MENNPVLLKQATAYVAKRSIPFSTRIVLGLTALTGGLAVFGSGLVAYAIYPGWTEQDATIYVSAATINAVLTGTGFYFASLYNFRRITTPRNQYKTILISCTLTFLILISFAFAFKLSAHFSRIWAFSWFFSATVLVCLVQGYCHILLGKWARDGRLTRNIVIVGAEKHGERLIECLGERQDPWIRILGVFEDRISRAPASIKGYPVLGNLDTLVHYVQQNRVDDVLVALPWIAENRMLDILQQLRVLPVHVRLCPDMVGFNFPDHGYSHYGGIPVLNIFEKPLADWKYVVKAVEDRVGAALILLLMLPVMAIIYLLIKLDSPGPVFFRQKRYGFNHKPIEVVKFRTMYFDQQDDACERPTVRNDPRVTRVGAFLRRASLDEIPQFINVLKGDMSIVGPRPHALADKVAQYAIRHRVKPGITGWAQVNGYRGETDTEEKVQKRVQYDIYYIEHWSLMLDLWIILRTIWVVLHGRNAY